MKKFGIKKSGENKWIVSHYEFPKFTCTFENKKFDITRKIKGLPDSTTDLKEVLILQHMEQWLIKNHTNKII